MRFNKSQWLTTKELSSRWDGKPSVRTLEGWRSKGLPPKFTRFGRIVKYFLGDIIAYEKRNKK